MAKSASPNPELSEFTARALRAEIERLQGLLAQCGTGTGKRGRPAGSGASPAKRQLSPEARARISEAQKKRWAEKRGKGKKKKDGAAAS